LARLTLLGFLYIPLSFMSSLFSMQPDVLSLGDTMKWYFAGALPLAVISLTLAWIMTQARVKRFGLRIIRKLGLSMEGDNSE
jgi:Mg2+ and Co2+ transporter CorA